MLEPVWSHQGEAPPDLSVLMPVYRTPAYVAEAVRSVLSQQGCVLDILISDDCSGDGTLKAALAAARAQPGPHSIRVFRTRRRLAIDHLGALVAEARCDFMVEAHGDDISLPGRMARLLELHRETGVGLVTSLVWSLRRTGKQLQSMPPAMTEGFMPDSMAIGTNLGVIQGARYGFHRDIYSQFPALNSQYVPRDHDVLQAVRALLVGGVYVSGEPLLVRRHHPGQWSNKLWDHRMQPAADFGYALCRLGALAIMRTDLEHFAAHHPGSDRVASLGPLIDAEERRMLDWLVKSRHTLRYHGFEPQWRSLKDLRRDNRVKLVWPPPPSADPHAARAVPIRRPLLPRIIGRLRRLAGRA